MQRVSYLWGTNEKEYTELGRSEGFDAFLKEYSAAVPGAILQEIKHSLTGCRAVENAAGADASVNVRWLPLHLNKLGDGAFSQMKPFNVLAVTGRERSDGTRESYYTHLTLMDRKETVNDKDHSFLDHIFGTAPLTPAEEAAYRSGSFPESDSRATASLPEAAVSGVDAELSAACFDAVKFIISVLYHNTGSRVVITLKERPSFQKEAFGILKQIYSLLPPKMALETGFSVYELPEDMAELSQKLNIRIFVIPAGKNDWMKKLPEGTVVVDPENDREFDVDGEMSNALEKWADPEAAANGKKFNIAKQAGCTQKRLQAMKYAFASEAEYYSRTAFLSRTKDFFADPYFAWEKSEKAPLVHPGAAPDYDTVKAVYALYRQFPYLSKVDWMRERFARHIPDVTGKGNDVNALKRAVVKSYSALDKENGENENAVKNHKGFMNWLKTLDDTDITFESADEIARFVREKTEVRKEKEKEQALNAQHEQFTAVLSEVEEQRKNDAEYYEAVIGDEKKRNEILKEAADAGAISEKIKVVEQKINDDSASYKKKIDNLTDEIDELKEKNRELRKKIRLQKDGAFFALVMKPVLTLVAGILLGLVLSQL